MLFFELPINNCHSFGWYCLNSKVLLYHNSAHNDCQLQRSLIGVFPYCEKNVSFVPFCSKLLFLNQGSYCFLLISLVHSLSNSILSDQAFK